MGKRLYRSRNNKVISGVCGGVGEYFNIDPTVIRILWVVIGFAGGAGVLAYIIAALIIPEGSWDSFGSGYQQGSDPHHDGKNDWNDSPSKFDSRKTNFLLGGILIFVGATFLLRQFIQIDFKYIVPLILILAGTAIIFRGRGY